MLYRKLFIRRLALMVAVALVAALAVIVSPRTASAYDSYGMGFDGNWPQSLDGNIVPRNIEVNDDGSITVIHCDPTSNDPGLHHYERIMPNGIVADSLDQYVMYTYNYSTYHVPMYPHINQCSEAVLARHSYVVGEDGTLYAGVADSPDGRQRVIAHKNGVTLWSVPVDVCSGTEGEAVTSLVMGGDGNLYAGVATGNTAYGGCGDAVASLTTSGQVRFTQILGTPPLQISKVQVWAYAGGFMAFGGNNTAYFFDFSGVEDTTKRHAFTTQPNTSEIPAVVFADTEGRMYAYPEYNWWSPCVSPVVLEYADSSGASGTINSPGLCEAYTNWSVLPNQKVARFTLNTGIPQVVTYGVSGELSRVNLPAMVDYRPPATVRVQPDVDGNVIVLRSSLKAVPPFNYRTVIDKVTLQGVVSTVFDSASLEPNNPDASYGAISMSNVDAAGNVYLPLCAGSGTCTLQNRAVIHKIAVSGFGESYPQYGWQYEAPEQLNYVAIGDSYSSGEGVEPFIAGTANTGLNECHRSALAYPMLLDQDPSLNLNLQGFVACSGAKVENIMATGQYGEYPQVNALNPDVDVVTITIGGNDVNFADTAAICNTDHETADCVAALQESLAIASSHEFKVMIHDTLAAIVDATTDAASGDHARVIALGYPQPLSIPGTLTWCGWAFKVSSSEERELVEDLVESLNFALELAASTQDLDYINPVDAFTGHFVCSAQPYVNGVVLSNATYSYHPNEEGHNTYYQLIASLLDD